MGRRHVGLGLVTLWLVGCYSPVTRDCAATCLDGEDCPVGFACGEDYFCHPGSPGDDFASCPVDAGLPVLPDADLVDADPLEPDAFVPDAEPACVLVPQLGCTLGEACDIDRPLAATGETLCRDVDEPGRETSTCTAYLECAAGYTCAAVLTSAMSCVEYCLSDAQCTEPGGLCVDPVTFGGATVPDVQFCSQDCEPIDTIGCPEDWGCHIDLDDASDRYYTRCLPGGSGVQGSECDYGDDCEPGYACIQYGGDVFCARYCDTNSLTGCDLVFGECVSFASPVELGGTEYGVCVE